MPIRLGDVAPDFTAETTEGTISFHEWLGEGWGILFSHPKDFTPVCTTELGAFAARKADFDKRNTKLIAVSVDDVESHNKWKSDIGETQGTAMNFPIIGDETHKVADLYDMIHPNASDTLTRSQRLHRRARQEGEAHADLPGVDRTQRGRDRSSTRLPAAVRAVPRRDTGELEGRRRRHHRQFPKRRGRQGEVPQGIPQGEGLLALHSPAQ
jgi:peroxiredoxin